MLVALALLAHDAAAAVQRARYLMGTVCEVAVRDGDEAAIENAFAEAARIEAMLSTWTDSSELARVNRGEAQPSPELRALLDVAGGWKQRTGGAFDPHIKALVDVWKTRGEGALPDANAIAVALRQQAIEEGGFGKGYAIDRMLAAIASPAAMINFGGQVAVRGEMRVAIADPADREKAVLELTLANASLSTSSGSEKTFAIGDRRFSHILDPRNGEALPPRGSASVISDDALSADILSTAIYVMGEDDGLRWADANGVAAIFINPQRQIRLSAKARERARGLELLDRNFSVKE